ncbi:MAG: alpha/beta hydrolase [Hyphomonadaceae bacterium]|nr:alpha/beta hydrolase [Hyphomonadaceae bacterium]
MLARSDAALIKASGGEPRMVRGMTLDPRMQFLEAQARKRAAAGGEVSVARARAQTEVGSEIFHGGRVAGVRIEKASVTGRTHTTPVRLYLPTVRDNSAALLVYFHAGGGVIGSLESCDRLCALIAKETGAPVVSVDYRLAPEHKFPVGLEDCRAVYLWALDNAARFGAPAGKVGVGGDSQGGNFAAILAQEFRTTRPPVLQLLIYPATDMVSETPSMHEFADAWPLTTEVKDFFMAHYLPAGADPADVRLSPGRAADLRGLAPALVYTAGFDILLDQGAAYAERLRESGVPVAYHCFETLPHGFVMFPGASPASQAAIQRIAREAAVALKGQG